MGVLSDRRQAALETNPIINTNNVKEDWKSEYYLNIGIQVPITNEQGEEELEFISLPVVCTLDRLKESKLSGSERAIQIKTKMNQIIRGITGIRDSLDKGESTILKKQFTVEIRRAGEEVTTTENDLSVEECIADLL